MAFDEKHALEILYGLTRNQLYRRPTSYSPPWVEFKAMFEKTTQLKFVSDTLLKQTRSWQPAPAPQKI
jgi:hypothetical protein